MRNTLCVGNKSHLFAQASKLFQILLPMWSLQYAWMLVRWRKREPRKVKQFLQGHTAESWVATASLVRAWLQHCATVPRRERAGLLSQGLLNECKWLRKMMVEKTPINLYRDNFSECDKSLKNINYRTSLVFQWLGIHLAMQRTVVQSLVGELSSHMSQSSEARVPQP